MELPVLSALEWKMNPVTPLLFIDHISRRLGLKSHFRLEFLQRCELSGSRSVCCLPFMLAAATVLHVIKEVEPCNALDYKIELMDVLNLTLSRDKVDALSKLIQELYGNNGDVTHKRRNEPLPTSPNGVVDAHFSPNCSNESWATTSSVSSSPEPQFKKRRNHHRKMRLDPQMHMSVVGSHH